MRLSESSAVDTIESRDQKLGNAKRIVIFVLGPALIAGFFSIVPTIYNEIMKPRAALSYTVISGPSIPTSEGFRRIFGTSVQNTGKVDLDNIDVEINTTVGRIENIVAEKSLLHPTVSQNPPTINIPRMPAGEQINFSVMSLSSAADSSISVNARSDKAVGLNQSIGGAKESLSYLDIVGALLASISVALMSVMTMLIIRSKGRLGILVRTSLGDKPDIITFIAGLSGAVPMTQSMLVGEHEMSYARLADLFLISGLNKDNATRTRCTAGLEALLMVRGIAERSVGRIRHNLSVLGVNYNDDEFRKIRNTAIDPDKDILRQRIADRFLSLDSPTLNLPDHGQESSIRNTQVHAAHQEPV